MTKKISISGWSCHIPGQEVDLSAVPLSSRRRLSSIQKIYFALASRASAAEYAAAVFATKNGEDSVTRRLVDDFNCDGSVSPQRFSSSVYNAAPGLWSIFAGNHSTYTAVAAGEESLEAGLIEALTGPMPSLCVYAEETDGGYGIGVQFDSCGDGGVEVEFSFDSSASALSFDDFVAFLSSDRGEAAGRYIRFKRMP